MVFYSIIWLFQWIIWIIFCIGLSLRIYNLLLQAEIGTVNSFSQIRLWENEVVSRFPGGGAATLRIFAQKHMSVAESRAAKPFILTLDSVGGVCYLIAVFMLLLSRFQSNISCIDTALFPTLFPKHIVVWRRPASEQTFRQGMYQRLSFCVVSHDSHVRWHCLSESSTNAVTENPCKSRFLQCCPPPF